MVAQVLSYRMPLGWAGDVTKPNAKIEPCLVDATHPPSNPGVAVLINPATAGARTILTTDTAIDAIYGITVRSFPFQAASGSNFGAADFGNNGLPNGVIDVLRSGYILVPVSGGGSPQKGGRVYIWNVASTGSHVLGGFETQATANSTIELDEKTYWSGGVDANGNAEISFNI
jgi:hypothetical protein